MKDPFGKIFEDISKALTKLSNMIVWLAKRTLSAKDYVEFADEFSEKKTNDMETVLTELLKNKEET